MVLTSWVNQYFLRISLWSLSQFFSSLSSAHFTVYLILDETSQTDGTSDTLWPLYKRAVFETRWSLQRTTAHTWYILFVFVSLSWQSCFWLTAHLLTSTDFQTQWTRYSPSLRLEVLWGIFPKPSGLQVHIDHDVSFLGVFYVQWEPDCFFVCLVFLAQHLYIASFLCFAWISCNFNFHYRLLQLF